MLPLCLWKGYSLKIECFRADYTTQNLAAAQRLNHAELWKIICHKHNQEKNSSAIRTVMCEANKHLTSEQN